MPSDRECVNDVALALKPAAKVSGLLGVAVDDGDEVAGAHVIREIRPRLEVQTNAAHHLTPTG
jgi:hypothetical protein